MAIRCSKLGTGNSVIHTSPGIVGAGYYRIAKQFRWGNKTYT
jgi:hypothetical protein